MEFKKQKPIYQQIADTLCSRIVEGKLQSDERMPSLRDVAVQLSVNPNTVMRTFDYLQQSEIIYNRRGVGYFVAPKAQEKIQALHRKEFMEEELPAFLHKCKLLGIGKEEIVALMEAGE